MPRRVMITGISGFVGPYLAEHLSACGDSVLGCSLDGSCPSLSQPVEMIAWDLGRALSPAVRHTIECFAPEAIYHLAALSVPADCGHSQPLPATIAVNVEGTRRALELAVSLASPARVLVISTSHVYAAVDAQSPYVTETSPLDPRTGYAHSKFLAEEETHRAVRDWKCDAIIARSFNHTGPGQTPRLMLPQWARQFAADDVSPIQVYTRDAYLDMTDVRDVVRAYRLLIEQGQSGAIYNVGSGLNRRSGDILDLLRSAAGQPNRPVIETQPGTQQGPIADNTRLVRATGWCPVIPLEQTVADTLAWWRKRVNSGQW